MPLSSPAEPSLSHHSPPASPGPGAVPGLRAVVGPSRARRLPVVPEDAAPQPAPAAAPEEAARQPAPAVAPPIAEVPANGPPPSAEVRADAPPPLPDPRPLVTNLARCVVEILAGAREIEQIARWVNDEVYRHLLKRVVLATRARSTRSTPAERPRFSVGAVRVTEPSAGVVEAVVIMHGRARSRAVAVRLESMGTRWRATAIHVL